jgi:plastocyanin
MKRLFVAAAAAWLIAVPAAPAGAAVAVTAPGGFVAGFVPPVVVVAEGEEITYVNADVAPHNFIALDAFRTKKQAKKAKWCSAFDKGRCPLFWSETITAGQTTDVLGLEVLKSGDQYAFFCSLHPGMKGTLIVR